ncbi:hypothetical protein [Microvirga subterranea]|uniref:Uncharacterized protein n=1 Tax=Microvirga subterranea TaxID=186651 RepID=A0A370HMS2_9HYPH|nr:hypothetical protein [Microvirga subterranea]RDI59862.1 hypothetical protein DES45_103118 [Microvirga subterranea]
MARTMLRALAAAFVAIGTLLWLWLILSAIMISSDAMGEGLAFGFAFIATLAFFIFTVPAGVLVYREKWLPFALVLAVVSPLAAIVLI